MNQLTDLLVKGFNATVKVAYGAELAALHDQLWELPGDKYMWVYTLDVDYLDELMMHPPHKDMVYALVDYRARHHAAYLAHLQRRFRARSWSWNRTLHAKGIIAPAAQLLWTTSANCNRASHLHGRNLATITHSADAIDQALRHWTDAWQRSTPIAPQELAPNTVNRLTKHTGG